MEVFWILVIVAGFAFIAYKAYQMKTRVHPVKVPEPRSNTTPTGTHQD